MAYSDTAKQRRKCTATRKDGQPCRAWALWSGDTCSGHTYTKRARHTRPREYPTRYTPCTCIAYQWPHRPGSGLCRWPDAPLYRLLTPAGTHSWPRISSGWKYWYRLWERLRSCLENDEKRENACLKQGKQETP